MGTKLLVAGSVMLTLAGAALVAVSVTSPFGERDTAGYAIAGLTGNGELVGFTSDDPQDFTSIGAVSGLQGDQRLVGIDCRVSNATVYGVGDQGGIYTLSLQTAAATKVSQLTVALDGDSFDVDFNPAANRLRVVSDTGQNLRHNIDDPNGMPAVGQTVADSPLSIPPEPATVTGVTGAAYYNNDQDMATATTLFGLDTSLDQVVIQSPANAGTLAATGKLGVDAQGDAGFDIHYDAQTRGATGHGRGIATLNVGGSYRLYEIELLTGRAVLVGEFPPGQQVIDLTTGFLNDEIEGIEQGQTTD
jgi:Domain of unknown function (DUF4394)